MSNFSGIAPGNAPADATRWPARKDVEKRLGISRAQIRRLTTSGRLNAVRIGQEYRYDPITVEALEAARTAGSKRRSTDGGELAARAFALFREKGVDRRLAVIELQVTPEVACRLADEYARLGGELMLSREAVEMLRQRLGARDMLRTEADVLAAALERSRRAAAETAKQVAERDAFWAARVKTLEAKTGMRDATQMSADVEHETGAREEAPT